MSRVAREHEAQFVANISKITLPLLLHSLSRPRLLGLLEKDSFALQAARAAIQTPLKDNHRREIGSSAASELSLGQWCLPMLLSPDPSAPVIDWEFPPKEIQARYTSRSLSSIRLPERFVGRRAEMRAYKNRMFKGEVHKLLITGPGGQGKTALAGKLAWDLQRRGYQVFA